MSEISIKICIKVIEPPFSTSRNITQQKPRQNEDADGYELFSTAITANYLREGAVLKIGFIADGFKNDAYAQSAIDIFIKKFVTDKNKLFKDDTEEYGKKKHRKYGKGFLI